MHQHVRTITDLLLKTGRYAVVAIVFIYGLVFLLNVFPDQVQICV